MEHRLLYLYQTQPLTYLVRVQPPRGRSRGWV